MSSSSVNDADVGNADPVTSEQKTEAGAAPSRSIEEEKAIQEEDAKKEAEAQAKAKAELERVRALPLAERLPAMLARRTPKLELLDKTPSDSPIWNYFSVVTPSPFKPVKAVVCLPCFAHKDEVKILEYRTLSALRSHIKYHPAEAKEIEKLNVASAHGSSVPSDAAKARKLIAEKAKAEADGDDERKRKAQSKLDAFLPKAKKRCSGVQNAKEIHYALSLWRLWKGNQTRRQVHGLGVS